MKTTWRQRRRWEDLLVDGSAIPIEAVLKLVQDADEAERLEHQFEAFRIALEEVGLKIVDVTTDDEDGTVLEIIAMEPV